MDIENNEELLSIKEVAEIKHKSPDTIRRWIKKGDIKAEKLQGQYGKQWVIKKSDIVKAEQSIEVIPVKKELQAQQLKEIIKVAVAEALTEQNEELKDQIQQLNNKIDKLENRRSFTGWVKDLFKKA